MRDRSARFIPLFVVMLVLQSQAWNEVHRQRSIFPRDPRQLAAKLTKHKARLPKSHRAIGQAVLPADIPAVQFLAATRVDAGGSTSFPVVGGDFNGDHFADAVTIVQNTSSSSGFYLAEFLGTGQGTFNSQLPIPVSFASNDFILVGDLDKNGRDDVVLVHQNSIDVLMSSSNGAFVAAVPYPTSIGSPVAAALWDVNHDHALDVVVVDALSNQASYLAGNDTGVFQSPAVTLFPDTVAAGVLADVDADGNLDLVTNSNVYPGDGSGGFLAPVAMLSSDGQNSEATLATSVAVADVNGDNLPDVVTANGSSNTVSVFLNHGARSLVQDGISVWTGNGPMAVSVGDVNADHVPDLVVTNGVQSDFAVLLGQGSGAFLPAVFSYAVGGSPSTRPMLADFNSDGALDVLLADNQSSIVLTLGLGDGSFIAALDDAPVVPAGSSNYGGALSLAIADFNGDGLPDFVVGQNSIFPGLGLIRYLTQANGKLDGGASIAPTDALSFVAVGDINQDGKMDVVASNWATGSLEILLGKGDGTFQPPTSVVLPGYTNGVIVADFNGDGWPDVALAGVDSHAYVLMNDGSGNLAVSNVYPLSAGGYKITAADINNDGIIDILIPLTSSSEVAILLGDGAGHFVAAPDFETTGSSPYGIAVADLNADGKPDLAISSLSDGSIAVALGNADGTFAVPVLYPATIFEVVSPFPGEIEAVDLNGDGKLDLAFPNSNQSSIGVLLGVGNGSFAGPFEFPSGGFPIALVTVDLDQDGKADVVTADSNFSGISIFYNKSVPLEVPDYLLSSDNETLVVATGATASVTLTLQSLNKFADTVQLSCANLPASLTCSFLPDSTPVSSGGIVTSKLTVSAAATAAQSNGSHRSQVALVLLPLLGFVFFFRVPQTAKKIMMLVLACGMMSLTGCQSVDKSPPAPPPQSQIYTITVNAVSSHGLAHAVEIQVTVQP